MGRTLYPLTQSLVELQNPGWRILDFLLIPSGFQSSAKLDFGITREFLESSQNFATLVILTVKSVELHGFSASKSEKVERQHINIDSTTTRPIISSKKVYWRNNVELSRGDIW